MFTERRSPPVRTRDSETLPGTDDGAVEVVHPAHGRDPHARILVRREALGQTPERVAALDDEDARLHVRRPRGGRVPGGAGRDRHTAGRRLRVGVQDGGQRHPEKEEREKPPQAPRTPAQTMPDPNHGRTPEYVFVFEDYGEHAFVSRVRLRTHPPEEAPEGGVVEAPFNPGAARDVGQDGDAVAIALKERDRGEHIHLPDLQACGRKARAGLVAQVAAGLDVEDEILWMDAPTRTEQLFAPALTPCYTSTSEFQEVALWANH